MGNQRPPIMHNKNGRSAIVLNNNSALTMRFILIILAVLAAALIIRTLLSRSKKPGPASDAPQAQIHNIVKCAYCGVHLPEHDAVKRGDKHYCCWEHADKDS